MTNESVAAGKVVIFHYTVTNDAGDVLDTSVGAEPLPYLHGSGNIVPGLESAMDGHTVGDTFKATISPEEGYGERTGPGPQPVPRAAFPADLDLQPGMQFAATTESGATIPVWIVRVAEDVVHVDTDHPLAGETLHFDVEIVDIRDATAEEIAHGHPHGRDGRATH